MHFNPIFNLCVALLNMFLNFKIKYFHFPSLTYFSWRMKGEFRRVIWGQITLYCEKIGRAGWRGWFLIALEWTSNCPRRRNIAFLSYLPIGGTDTAAEVSLINRQEFVMVRVQKHLSFHKWVILNS